ncbi:ArsR/SmtB family transcription factor [Micromonospora endolithica]|uniref:ArsR family transcriptional regulator n=1 Tax=Micromonospora endolithica TaxID=230091 RepID=A0A3A9ZSI1_9ACTN|nr:metalloregulator ArsR/SmtB family transcription factor [Micromonospora endolithica]RKN51232.1 ArsR family transcriptional regulator [Micromonospora endolithica]TWJ20994.1 tellurite resistance protein TerB [Micromonospora endolithica]
MEQSRSEQAHRTPETGTDSGDAALAQDTQEFLKALGSPTRQRIMMLFAQGAELSVGEIAQRVGISQATASQQLTLLRRGRVVAARREGKSVYYRADRDGVMTALADLQAYLTTCC